MERKYFKSLTDQERQQLKEKIFQHLQISEQGKKRAAFPARPWVIGIAATLFVAIGLLTFRGSEPLTGQKVLIASTMQGEVKQLTLADGSVVILNGGSTLYAHSGYLKGHREVYLTGNGFFKVKKLGSQQKFVVHANSLQVMVLGTEFNVNARTEQVAVALTSGKVRVAKNNNGRPPEYMVPGDKLTLGQQGVAFERSRIDTSLYSAWTNGEWSFKNSSLEQIAAIINEYYNIKVSFKNKQTMDQRITAVIPVTTLDGLLKVIRETLPVAISENNQQLFIQ